MLQATPRGSPGTATLRRQHVGADDQHHRRAAAALRDQRERLDQRAEALLDAPQRRALHFDVSVFSFFGELGVGLHRAGPAGVVGLVDVGLGAGGVEA